MNGPTADQLLERLGRLERHHRYLKLAAVLMLVGMITGVAGAQGYSPIVEAQTFVLRDQSGKVRATLGLDRAGSPVLAFHDLDGVTRIVLGIVDGEPRLNVVTRDGRIAWEAP